MNTNDQIRTVVFDVDGTLFDTLPSLAAAANEVLVLAGLQAVDKELYEAKRSGRNRVCLHGTEKTPKPAEPRSGRDRSGPTGL